MRKIKANFTPLSILLIPIAVAINFLAGTLAFNLKLPIYMDMIGTFIVSFLGGPWIGALTGVLSIALNSINDPMLFPYTLVSGLLGFLVGVMTQWGWFKNAWRTILSSLLIAAVAAGISILITVGFFGGFTASGVAGLKAVLMEAFGFSFWGAQITGGILSEIPDKLISLLITYSIVKSISARYVIKYPSGRMFADKAEVKLPGQLAEKVAAAQSQEAQGKARGRTAAGPGKVQAGLSKREALSVLLGFQAGKRPARTSQATQPITTPEAAGVMREASGDAPVLEQMSDAEILAYLQPEKHGLEALSPLTWLAFTLVGVVGSILFDGRFILPLVVLTLLLALGTSHQRRFFKRWLKTAVLLAIVIAFFQVLVIHSGTEIWRLGFFTITTDGVERALHFGLRILGIFTPVLLAIEAVDANDLLLAMERKGVSPLASYVILSSLNMIPEMGERLKVITDAQKSRAIETEGSLWTRFKAFVPVLTPVILSAIVGIEERAMTLDVRGFEADCPKTALKDVTDTPGQVWLRRLFYLIIILMLVGRVWYGLHNA